MKMTNILYGIGFLLATIVINKYVTIHVVEQELTLYAQQNPTPKIAVFDIEAVMKERQELGEAPAKTLRHIGLLTLAASTDNMLLLDKKSVLAASDTYSLPEITTEDLETRLRAAGKDIPSEAEYLKLLEQKKAETLRLFNELDADLKIGKKYQ